VFGAARRAVLALRPAAVAVATEGGGVGSYFIPIGTTHAADSRINIDGFLTLSNPNDTGQHRAYVQVFRPGAVEAVACLGEHVEIRALGVDIVRHARLYTTALQECDAEPPFMVMASILGTRTRGSRPWITINNYVVKLLIAISYT